MRTDDQRRGRRFLVVAGTAALLVAALPRRAAASPVELTAAFGGAYYSAANHVFAGVGGGVGVRVRLTPTFGVYAEGRYLTIAGNVFTVAAGGFGELRFGLWAPLLGVQLAMFGGDHVAVLSDASPQPPLPVAFAVQARLAPLRFRYASFSAAALVFDVGLGLDRDGVGPALALTLLEAGVQF